MADRFHLTGASGFSTSSAPGGSVKAKLRAQYETLQNLTEDINKHVEFVNFLKQEKERIEAEHDQQAQNVRDELNNQMEEANSYMKKSFAANKSEKAKLQGELGTLKGEKTMLQQQLLALQRRIAELEVQLGNTEDF